MRSHEGAGAPPIYRFEEVEAGMVVDTLSHAGISVTIADAEAGMLMCR
jgi:hypothetical protein